MADEWKSSANRALPAPFDEWAVIHSYLDFLTNALLAKGYVVTVDSPFSLEAAEGEVFPTSPENAQERIQKEHLTPHTAWLWLNAMEKAPAALRTRVQVQTRVDFRTYPYGGKDPARIHATVHGRDRDEVTGLGTRLQGWLDALKAEEPVVHASETASQPAPVKKPWYRSTWFWGTSVLGAIGVFIGILNFVLNVAGG